MKLSSVKFLIFAFLALLFTGSAISSENISEQDMRELNSKINEIKTKGLKPTDENIYNICVVSSMLIINAANDAVSGQYVGDKHIGGLLLISHDEYRDIVKELIKSDAVPGIVSNTDGFDRTFQMKCRASPDKYIKKYKDIFRLKLTSKDQKEQW